MEQQREQQREQEKVKERVREAAEEVGRRAREAAAWSVAEEEERQKREERTNARAVLLRRLQERVAAAQRVVDALKVRNNRLVGVVRECLSQAQTQQRGLDSALNALADQVPAPPLLQEPLLHYVDTESVTRVREEHQRRTQLLVQCQAEVERSVRSAAAAVSACEEDLVLLLSHQDHVGEEPPRLRAATEANALRSAHSRLLSVLSTAEQVTAPTQRGESIDPQRAAEMSAVWLRTLTESVEDEVATARQRSQRIAESLKAQEEIAHRQNSEFALMVAMHNKLEEAGGALGKAVEGLRDQEERAALEADNSSVLGQELHNLSAWYRHFFDAAGKLPEEIRRRKRERESLSSLVRDFQSLLSSLHDNEVKKRQEFYEEHGRFLPAALYPPLSAAPVLFSVTSSSSSSSSSSPPPSGE